MRRTLLTLMLTLLALSTPARAVLVTVSITSGGSPVVNAAPSSSIPVEITITSDEPIVSWQLDVLGDAGFSHPGILDTDYNNVLWDQAFSIEEAAGNLPIGNIGSLNLAGVSGTNLAVSFSMTVPAINGAYTITIIIDDIGDESFQSVPPENITLVPLTVIVPEPATLTMALLSLPLLYPRRLIRSAMNTKR